MAWKGVRQLSNTDKSAGTQNPEMNDSRRVVCLLQCYCFSSQQMSGQEIIISPSRETPITSAFFFFLSVPFHFISFWFLMSSLSHFRNVSRFYDQHCSFVRNVNGSSQTLKQTPDIVLMNFVLHSKQVFTNSATVAPRTVLSNIESIRRMRELILK